MFEKHIYNLSLASHKLNAMGAEVLPLCARFLFILTLLMFFWKSALTKFGSGVLGFLTPSIGAYAQIFPKKFEAVGYDPAAMSVFDWGIVMTGAYGELIFPLLIVVGFATRLAALGMLGFILVMSVVDVTGHGVAMRALFDGDPMSIIPDQRLFWCMPLVVLMFTGAGSLSIDRLLFLRHGYALKTVK